MLILVYIFQKSYFFFERIKKILNQMKNKTLKDIIMM